MPTYPMNKTYRGGFYTNVKDGSGNNDRTYSAEEIRKPYNIIYSNGIRPDVDGTAGDILKVSAEGGFGISVNSGFAILGGAWFENVSPYKITLDNPIAETRYDCVILQNNDSLAVRAPSIYIKSLNHIPTVDDLTRDDDVYEVCIAYITVNPNNIAINQAAITDTRTEGSLCNVMTGVGATVVRAYRNTYYTTSTNQKIIPIGISQFNKANDELIVSVEGMVFTQGTQYTITNDSQITLTTGLPVTGTKIDFVVHKNVNGTVSGNVNEELNQLITNVTNIQKTVEHDYYCNGSNDNVKVSELVKEYLVGTGYGSVRLNIHGTFVGSQPVLTNSSTNTDYWFDFSGSSDRKVIVDFTDCSQIIIPINSGKTNVIFYGTKIDIVGANLIVNNTAAETSIVVFDGSAEIVNCENSRFWITGDKYSYISKVGTFTNCRGSVTNSKYYSYCFYTNNLVRLFGGEYYAYTADSGAKSGVVGQTGAESITIMYGVNAPTVARSGYYQTNAVNHIGTAGNAGVICCTDLISTLPIADHSGTDNFRGTIKLNKPNMM